MTKQFLNVFVSTAIISLILLVLFGTIVGAEGINRFYLPDENLISGGTSSTIRPDHINFDHFNRPIFSTQGTDIGVTDGRVGIVNMCSGAVSYKYTYPNSTSNWGDDRKIITDNTGTMWLIKRSMLSELIISDDGDISVGREVTLPMPGGTGPRDIYLNSDDTVWYIVRANSGNSSILKTDLNGNTLFTIPTTVVTIGGVAPDESGNVWYADMGNNQIVKYNIATGLETKYNTTMRRPIVGAITNNDKIWFGSIDDKYLSYITPTGSVTSLFISGWAYNMMTVSSDGYLWTAAEGKLAKINTGDNSYVVYPYTNTTGSGGTAITESPNGSFFFHIKENPKPPSYINANAYSILQYYEGTNPNDCTSPTVAFDKTITFSNASTTTLAITNADNVSVKKLKLYDSSDNLISEKLNPANNLDISVDTASLAEGIFDYTAVIYDSSGNKAETTGSVLIDRTNPTGTFTAPTSNETLANTVAVNVTASDLNGIDSVQFKVNGINTVKDTSIPYGFNLDTRNYADGSYTISAEIKDKAGNLATISRTIKIKNTIIPVAVPVDNAVDVIQELVRTPNAPQITIVVNVDGKTIRTVELGSDLSTINVEVEDKEILVVNGLLGDVIVKPGASVKGNGKLGSLLVQIGAYLEPGESPGCLSADNLTLEGTYRFEAGGALPCSGYDQARITGSVTLSGDLEVSLLDYTPQNNTTFILIDNDSDDAITGNFNNLVEGAVFEQEGNTYKISYVGGDGNDVTLEVVEVQETTTTEARAEATAEDSKASSSNLLLLTLVIAGSVLAVIIVRAITKDKPKS